MIVQWCMKGMALPDDAAARGIISEGTGLISNWWRDRGLFTPQERHDVLTAENLDLHVNHFSDIRPDGRSVATTTPFISLATGVVERDPALATNHVHRARTSALWFGFEFGRSSTAYVYTCWVQLALRQAIRIQAVAEEVRDLNTYRRYSAYQTEGEVTAKIEVPSHQIRSVERWDWDKAARTIRCSWVEENFVFESPEVLSNLREVI